MQSLVVLFVVCMVATSVASVCSNAVLLLVVALNKSLRTETWALILSSCLCDLALGLSAVPFGVHNGLAAEGYPSDGALCQAAGFAFALLQLASVHSLMWATVDRFAEIRFALHYPRIFTRGRTRLVLALLWPGCLLTAALPLLGFGSYCYSRGRYLCTPAFRPSGAGFALLFLVAGAAAPVLVICSLYAYLVYVARSQALRGTFVCNEQHCHYVPANNYLRSSVVMVTAVVCLLACWLPYITTCFYETFTGQDCPAVANALATWLVLFTATLNPWINYMTQKKYREALRGSLNKLRQRFRYPLKNSLPNRTRTHPPSSSRTARPGSDPLQGPVQARGQQGEPERPDAETRVAERAQTNQT